MLARSIALRLAFTLTTIGVAEVLVLPQLTSAQQAGGEVYVMPVRGNVFMIVGGAGNITLSAGVDGLLLVDTGSAEMADKVLAKVQDIGHLVAGAPVRMTTCVGPQCYARGSVGPYTQYGWASPSYNAIISSPAPVKRIRWIIQTTIDPDRTGATPTLAAAGRSFGTLASNVAGNVADIAGFDEAQANVIGHEKLLLRMTRLNFPEGVWPRETYYRETYKMSQYINGEGIQMYHAAAVTDGDTLVYFRFSDVISAGDVYTPDRYPMLDLDKGGTVQGLIDGLNKIIEMAFPEFRSQGGTMIIPGHGRLSDTADVAIYRNMAVIVRDRVQDLIEQGLSLQQVKAAKPTQDFDGIYGPAGKFIEAVYEDLTRVYRTGQR